MVVLNLNRLVIYFLLWTLIVSCSIMHSSPKQDKKIDNVTQGLSNEKIQSQVRSEEEIIESKKLVIYDTINAFFLYEFHNRAFNAGDAIVQEGSLLRMSEDFGRQCYDTVYSFRFMLGIGDSVAKSALQNEPLMNVFLLEALLFFNNDRTGNNIIRPYCDVSYTMCRTKLIINKGCLIKRRIPYLVDCDSLAKLKTPNGISYTEEDVWAYDILSVLDYELLNVNDYNIKFK